MTPDQAAEMINALWWIAFFQVVQILVTWMRT